MSVRSKDQFSIYRLNCNIVESPFKHIDIVPINLTQDVEFQPMFEENCITNKTFTTYRNKNNLIKKTNAVRISSAFQRTLYLIIFE